MTRSPRLALAASALLFAAVSSVPFAAQAQTAVPPSMLDHFKDTAPVRQSVTPEQPVVIYEFEDLECPACARAFPITHEAVAHYHIPLIRHDFPLPMHIWSRDAAITARYLQDKVSPQAAEQFRHDVFANQMSIDSKDDLQNFTHRWFEAHHLEQPFSLGPNSQFAREVQADYDLGQKIGLQHTPTIFVVSPRGWVQVVDPTQMYSVIDRAEAQAHALGGVHDNHLKPAGAQR